MNRKTEKINNPLSNYTRLSGISFFISVLSAAVYFLMFPSGIYYGFLLGVIGAAGGILSRPYTLKRGSSTLAIVVGVVVTLISFMSFEGLSTIYGSINDPAAGPEIAAYITEILESYGIPLEVFASLMRP